MRFGLPRGVVISTSRAADWSVVSAEFSATRARESRLRAVITLLACGAALLGSVSPAGATFAGRNGGFAYGLEFDHPTDDVSYTLYGWRVGLVDHAGGHRHFLTYGREPAFAPRGRRLAVAQRSSGGIAVLRLGGKPTMHLTSGIVRAPAWSPTGRRIAFERFRCTTATEALLCPPESALGIWTVGLGGGTPRA